MNYKEEKICPYCGNSIVRWGYTIQNGTDSIHQDMITCFGCKVEVPEGDGIDGFFKKLHKSHGYIGCPNCGERLIRVSFLSSTGTEVECRSCLKVFFVYPQDWVVEEVHPYVP